MKRLLPFIILIVLLLVAIISVPLLLNPERHRTEITNRLAAIFQRPIVLGPMSMSYFPPTLKLTQVGVLRDGGAPLLQIDGMMAPLDIGALFQLKFIPSALQLNHWQFTVLRKADGSWDLRDGLGAMPAAKGGGTLQLISWKEGEMHWVDRFGVSPQELVIGALEGRWTPKDGTLTTAGVMSGLNTSDRVTWTAKGQFLTNPQWSGDLQLFDQGNTCTIQVNENAGTFEAKGSAAKWRFADAMTLVRFFGRGGVHATDAATNALAMDNWQFHITGSSSRLSFEHHAGISGGLTESRGTIESKASAPVLHLDGVVKDVPAEVLWGVLGETILLSGKMTAGAKDVELVLSSRTFSTLSGQGYWELSGGRYQVPEVSGRKLAKAKTMAYMKKKFPDLETAGVPVTKLSAHWQAKNGTVAIDDGLFVSTDIKAAWVGKVDLARQGLDGYLRLQLHEKDSKLAALIPTRYHDQPAFGRLQGTLQEWFLWSLSSSKIPAAAQSKLRKAIALK